MKFRWSVTPPEAGPGPEHCWVCKHIGGQTTFHTLQNSVASWKKSIKCNMKWPPSLSFMRSPFVCLSLWAGLCAEEIHICGEPAAIDFIRELMYTTGEEMEVRLWPAAQQDQTTAVWLSRCHSLFCSLVAGPHLPAVDSLRYPGPSCGVVGQPPARGLHRVLQQERHLLHQQADRGQRTGVCRDLRQLTPRWVHASTKNLHVCSPSASKWRQILELLCDEQAPSCRRPRSLMTPMTPAIYWSLPTLLEWVLTCKCCPAHCGTFPNRCHSSL